MNREPAADFLATLSHVQRSAATLGVDAGRLGLWASSGHVPVALSALMRDGSIKVRCAALAVRVHARSGWRHRRVRTTRNNSASSRRALGKSVDDLAADVPMFLVRAGKDQFPGLNDAMDRFAARALAANLPLTLVNHANGPHAFDLVRRQRHLARDHQRCAAGF